jgi:NDP-sugar pyrophosphorylase family protein
MQTKNLIENKLKDIDVVILCGGIGSRLAKIVNDRPKPMARINQQPFLDILINYFTRFGLRRFILCAGYMSEIIQEYYGQKSSQLEFVVSNERTSLGTAGCIKKAQKFIQSEPFLVANGDSFCSLNLLELYDFHMSRSALMSMVVVESDETANSGLVQLDDSQRIINFEEKKSKAGINYINAGIYLFQKKILSLIPENKKYSLEYDLFPELIKHDSFALVSGEELIDIGTPKRYELAKEYFVTSHQNLICTNF